MYSTATLRADALQRARLVQRIEDGAREGRTLALISAPAGFGKTTLITAWLQHANRACAWLSLDDGDNDPIRFWRCVIAALQSIDPTIGSEEVIMERTQKNTDLSKTIFRGVALAMGIAVVVMNFLGTATPATLIMLLGVGLFALAVSSLV